MRINAAMGMFSDYAHQRRAALIVAAHALMVGVDKIVRDALGVAIADERRPGLRIGAARAAREAVESRQGFTIGMNQRAAPALRTIRSEALEYRRNALSAAYTHGDESVATA